MEGMGLCTQAATPPGRMRSIQSLEVTENFRDISTRASRSHRRLDDDKVPALAASMHNFHAAGPA